MSAQERRGALPHPAQLPEVLLRRVVRDAAQRLVQSGKPNQPAFFPPFCLNLELSCPDTNIANAAGGI